MAASTFSSTDSTLPSSSRRWRSNWWAAASAEQGLRMAGRHPRLRARLARACATRLLIALLPHHGRMTVEFRRAGLVVRSLSAVTEQVSSGCAHGGLEADVAHIDVGHPGVAALVLQVCAAPPNPTGGLAHFLPGRAVVLRLRPSVAGEVSSREGAVAQKARADLGSRQRCA